MMRTLAFTALVLVLSLSGCARSPDADMWECQLSVQKENAGKDAAAAAERTRDIDGCMDGRGFRLDLANPSCANAPTNAACYLPK